MSEKKRVKKSSLMTSSDVLQSLLQNGKSPLSEQFLRWKLWRKWPEVVGFAMAERSSPVGYDRGTLYVWVKNATWMQQMTFMIEPIRDKVNEFAGKRWVRRVQFTLDRRAVPGLNDAEKPMREFLDE